MGRHCGPSLTSGVISKTIRLKDQLVMLQSTCAVQAGASGGAVVQRNSGELLGRKPCLLYSVLSVGGTWTPLKSLNLQTHRVASPMVFLKERFDYLQALYPATQGTWLSKWPIPTSTSSFQWLFSRDCCINFTLKTTSMCSRCWTPQKLMSKRFGGSKEVKVNYNYGLRVTWIKLCF